MSAPKQYVIQLYRQFEANGWQTMTAKMSWNDAQDLLRLFQKDNPKSQYRVAMQGADIGDLKPALKKDVSNETE